jgi:hypothetical protein
LHLRSIFSISRIRYFQATVLKVSLAYLRRLELKLERNANHSVWMRQHFRSKHLNIGRSSRVGGNEQSFHLNFTRKIRQNWSIQNKVVKCDNRSELRTKPKKCWDYTGKTCLKKDEIQYGNLVLASCCNISAKRAALDGRSAIRKLLTWTNEIFICCSRSRLQHINPAEKKLLMMGRRYSEVGNKPKRFYFERIRLLREWKSLNACKNAFLTAKKLLGQWN